MATKMATTTEGSKRIDILSQPRKLHQDVIEDRRSVYWVDKRPPKPQNGTTTTFIVTQRQDELSQARVLSVRHPDRPSPIWEVSDGAKNAEPSGRVVALSKHKVPHPDFELERDVQTEVSQEAMSAQPSARIVQLSEPKPHKIWHNSHDTYRDPDFTRPITSIPTTALKAQASSRMETLAYPKQPHPKFEPEKPVQWPVSDNAKNATATDRLQQLARPKSARLKTDDYNPYTVSHAAKSARATPRVAELSEPLPRKQRNKKN